VSDLNVDTPMQKYLTLRQVADLTSMSIEFWRTRVKARDIDHVKIGRSVRIPLNALKSIIVSFPAIDSQNINKLEYT